MKVIKVIGEIICWILVVYFLIAECFGSYGITKYYVIGIIPILLTCPVLIKFVLKKLNVKHTAAVRVVLILICLMINYYTVTNAYRDKVVKVTYDAVINEMGEKYPEYDNILYDPVKRECIKICFQ